MQNTFLLAGQDGDMADGVLLILAKCVAICFLTTNHPPTSSCHLSLPCFAGFLASPDALEVIVVTYSLSHFLIVSTDLTDVTLVSDDTY